MLIISSCEQDELLEKKLKGEFHPSGSKDVLTTALKTEEHSGRVRAVGSFITPKEFFNLPRQRRITKDELLARDKQRSEELEKTKQDLMAQIAQLKAMIEAGTNIPSPMLSDNGSHHPETIKLQTPVAKELVLDGDRDCVHIDPSPPPSDNKVK